MVKAPSTFITHMNEVFSKHIEKHAIVYLNDIKAYSTNKEQHEMDLQEVLGTL